MTINVPKSLFVVLGSLLLLAGAGVAGFYYGKADVDTDAYYARGFAAGVESGVRKATRETQAKYEPGAPAYEAIYASGRRRGFKTGKAEGLGSGRREGFETGQDSAFEGYAGGWDIGRRYIIEIGQGVDGAKYSIPRRIEMETGQSYNLCPDDANDVCGGALD